MRSPLARSCDPDGPDRPSVTRLILRVLAGLALAGLLAVAPAAAQSTGSEPLPPKVQDLVRILDDPAVQAWLKSHGNAVPPAVETGSATMPAPSEFMVGRIDALRQHLTDLEAAWPTLPDQFSGAMAALSAESLRLGSGRVLLLVGLSILLGAVVEWIVRRLLSGFTRWADAKPLITPVARLCAAGLRLLHGIALVLAFALGSFALFAVSDWPPLLQQIVVGYLCVFILARAAHALWHFATAPNDVRFRLLPMSDASALHWCRRIALLVGWFTFGWVTVDLLAKLGFTVPGRQLIGYLLGVILLLIGLEAVWRRPAPAAIEPGGVVERRARNTNLVLSVYLLLLWLFWALGMMGIFWFAVFAFVLPFAIRIAAAMVDRIAEQPEGAAVSQSLTAYRVLAERGARGLLIILAALLLARAWNIDLTSMTASDTVGTRLLRGAVSAVIILLLADIAWRIIRALIDHTLAEPADPAKVGPAEARSRSRLRTLLPILRNLLFVVLLVISGLMVLSAMGVQIGPLIAGAGVVGVAIGFGAQTLVKDIISGVFYLLDDAFRVGEYIQSGSYKGTVESFSLRSVKLRHHRGPLYTVPFGELGAVQNMSRDWVIDKMMVGITYDSDLEKARKLIKQIGKDLAANPDFAPHILQPLKMQGVELFDDFAIKIRMKIMTKPNQQFTIRRKALAMIKKAFDENGIKFAQPTVQVAGGGGDAAAAAQQAIAITRPDPQQP